MGISWELILANYAEYLVSIGRSDITRTLRVGQVAYMARLTGLAPDDVSADDLTRFFAEHASWMPETRHSYTTSLRVFYRWAYKQRHTPTNPADDLPRIKVPRAIAKPIPDHVYRDTVASVEPRTALMLRLAGEAGLRRAEIARVHHSDLLPGPSLLVHGKGGKERIIPISDTLERQIDAADDWLFPSRQGGHLKPNTVGHICAAALPGIWTMHKARHRFATAAYRGSKNLPAVQRLLGHSSLATTQRYLAVDDDEMRAAMMFAA